ncbi:MAG: hypothetical protein LUH47_07660 [Clostridiales bacterium]|nr:hypothetical protein [Clostridiales bacterium]
MIQMSNNNYYSYYDPRFDDLTLILKRGVRSYSDEVYNDIYLVRAEEDDEVVGAQISYFSKRSDIVLKKYLPIYVYDVVSKIKSDIKETSKIATA